MIKVWGLGNYDKGLEFIGVSATKEHLFFGPCKASRTSCLSPWTLNEPGLLYEGHVFLCRHPALC